MSSPDFDRRRPLRWAILAGVAGLVLAGCQRPAPALDEPLIAATDDAETDLKQFQGEWFMVAFDKEGSKLPEKFIKTNTLTVKGQQWVYKSKNLGYEKTVAFELYTASSPKGIDMTETGGDKDLTVKGVYKIEGDTLTICRATDSEGPRPSRISGEDRGVALMAWKRAKK